MNFEGKMFSYDGMGLTKLLSSFLVSLNDIVSPFCDKRCSSEVSKVMID